MPVDTETDGYTPALRVAPRENLAARSAIILKQYLLSDHLKPGNRLPPERRLAEALNVSRTVLREAINQLIGEGLVRRDPSRSPTVADFDRARLALDLSRLDAHNTEIQELIELRVLLELGAIELIVERASDEDLLEMERWVTEGERCLETGDPLTIPDFRFHAALLRALGNRSVDALLPLVEEHMRQGVTLDGHELEGVTTDADRHAIATHREILGAIKRRDANQAKLLMTAHLENYLRTNERRQERLEAVAP